MDGTVASETIAGIMQIANIGAWIVIAYFFMTGKIFSAHAVEKFISAQKETTFKVAQEVADKIEKAVENGVMKAYVKMNGQNRSD